MAITFRNFDPMPHLGEDYARVRDFLLEIGATDFSFGRWDWMVTHSMLEAGSLERIGIWEDGDLIVALASHDTMLGDGHFCVRPGYEALKGEMLHYGARTLCAADGRFAAVIPQGDTALRAAAAEAGFVETDGREEDAIYDLPDTPYALPEGFRIVSMADEFDISKYDRVLYKGFNHETTDGPYRESPEHLALSRAAFLRPNVDPHLKVAVAAPDGEFVSYCGMWYDPAVDFAIVEPVATDPAYRRMGLGRAAVLEGIRRCYALGARRAFVGSSQQFYYSIGFRPYAVATIWRRKNAVD